MIRSTKTSTLWTHAVQSNRLPSSTVQNHSLAKTATSLAIYVPMYMAEKNVNFVTKLKSPQHKGSESFDLVKPISSKSMDGSGLSREEYALLHPIKVTSRGWKNLKLVFFVFLGIPHRAL